jgi:tryptophanyl-tRNA synthetase
LRVLSGIQPSGALHLGNYFAMMKRMIDYQENHELFCFVVNYHALTTVQDAAVLRENTFNACADFLALGIDPHKSYFYVQADIPEVTELTWILSNMTEMGLLLRAHSYKDKIAKGIEPNHGLFAYPVLMAADILLYGAQLVPIGKDQKQHVEMTRDIAQKFNYHYGEVFVLPEADIQEDLATIPGIDGQKMSKSYGNTIELFAPKEQLKKRVMSIVTDARAVEEPKDPDNCTLFAISSLFLDKEGRQELKGRYLKPGLKYGEVKKELVEIIWNYFEPYREKREHLISDPDYLRDIMREGAKKTRVVALEYLEKARAAVGLKY